MDRAGTRAGSWVAGVAAAILSLCAATLTPGAVAAVPPAGITAGSAIDAMTVVAGPVVRRSHFVRGSTFTPTPVMQGHPQWVPNSRVSYSLANFTADQTKIVRSALKENGKAIRVTYYQVKTGGTLRLVRHKLYATDAHGTRTALPAGVVGLGGPGWNERGVIVSGTVEISPRANTLAATSYRSLLLHEIGHAAGLEHSEHVTSVMYPSLQPDSPSHYSAEDLASLKPRH